MMEYLHNPNVPMDDDHMYLGAVLRNNCWRFFYSFSLSWSIDMRGCSLYSIPKNREDHLYYRREEFEDFLNTLDIELTAQHIHARVGKLPLKILIDFDNSRIVEGTGTWWDEGFEYTERIPSEWEIISRHPIDYLPYEIRSLWVTRHYLRESEQIGLNDYTSVCAIKTKSKWYFFFGLTTDWLLDYQSFSRKIGLDDYLKRSNYNHYREKLPMVDETNVEMYLNFLSNNIIPQADIPHLVYLPNADWHSEKGFTDLRQPILRFIIDFDEQLYVRHAFREDQINLQVESSLAYLPSHWTCHQNNALDYLPDELQKLWDVSH